MPKTSHEDFSYPPVKCSRILQVLDSEKRFSEPYGTKSPFYFAFRDAEFRKPGSRSYKYYMALRRCKDIKEYRQQVVELYQDLDIDIEINGESKKFPIQMIPIPPDCHKALSKIAEKKDEREFPPLEIPLILLSTLPLPRLLASPPTGRFRREYLTELLTNKIIDYGLVVPETELHLGIKYLGIEISKSLAYVEGTLKFAHKVAATLKSVLPRPVAISLRGTMADNPAVIPEAFRVPISCDNFWEGKHQEWPTIDIDLNIFCGEEDFEDIYNACRDESLFSEFNTEIKGLSKLGDLKPIYHENSKEDKYVDIYVMTDEWVLSSIQRHLHLGLEQPWAYYYASSYPLIFDDWKGFLESFYKHMHS